MSRRSRDARAVVTGAGSGIGQAFAVELARRGGQVVVSDIDLLSAQRTVDAITDEGGQAIAVQCDVSSLASVQSLADEAVAWFEGPPTLVVNNAGVGIGGDLVGDVPIEDWQWALGINLWGPIHGCHVFTPLLRQAGEGGLINVASAASFGVAPRMSAYNVGKAGVVALSETLRAELAGSGVSVSVLCPTLVKTSIFDNGRIAPTATTLGSRLMSLVGYSPQRIARGCLDAHDRGALHVVPQLDAKLAWVTKRAAPATWSKSLGLIERFTPTPDPQTHDHAPVTEGR